MTSRSLTTMPCPVDMSAWFPPLAATARETTRLHPRPGTPDARSSSMGGPLLWPVDEPWPTCDSPWCTLDDQHAPENIPQGDSPLVPVLQIFHRDVPNLPFPYGCDILQLLWCPFSHQECEPLPWVIWRREADLDDAVAGYGTPHADAPSRSVPTPCTVAPERVIEYSSEGLSREQLGELGELSGVLEAETGWGVSSDLLVAPGTKLGGHPSWVQAPDWPVCACGVCMEHLATIASWEYDGAFSRRLLPLEELPLFDLAATAGELSA